MKYLIDPYELELLEACKRNEAKSQKLLYDRYKDAMYTLCYRVVGDFERAADALQEGFLQVFNSLDNFKGNSSLGAWIKTIVVRAAYKIQRIEYNFVDLDEEIIGSHFYWDNQLNGEELEQAILDLSSGYRMVFTLIEIEGYSHKEVAEILEISAGTSKSQLYHAKKSLQKRLAYILD